MSAADVREYYRRVTEIDIGQVARELLGDRITQETGSRLECDCPRHKSKTRLSLHIRLDVQGWYCFGCGVGGNVLQLVEFVQSGQVTKGQSGPMPETHRQARDYLASKVGLPPLSGKHLSKEDLERIEDARGREMRAKEALSDLAEFYHQRLRENPKALEWLQSKYGLTEETIARLKIGFADNSRWKNSKGTKFTGPIDALKRARGFSKEDLEATGAFLPTSQNGLFPFFNGRIIFPYWSRGQVAFLIGRKTPWTPANKYEHGKYKKLPVHDPKKRPYISPAIHNGYIYNEDCLLDNPEQVLITEGVTDCIAAMQAGIPCISPVTTTFRKNDIKKLVRLAKRAQRVVICNDSEESGAGEQGALKTAQALHSDGCHVRIATLPRDPGVDKVDLNDFLRENTPEAFAAVLDDAKRLPDYLLDKIPADTSKMKLEPKLKPALEAIAATSRLERDGYLDVISKRFGLTRKTTQGLLADARNELATRQKLAVSRYKSTESEKEGSEGPIKGEVRQGRSCYYIDQGDDQKIVISSFVIAPTERVQLEHGEVIIGDVVTDQGRVFKQVHFPPRAWHSKRNLIQMFPTADMQWTGTDDNVQGVLRLLTRQKVPIRKGTQTMGYHETGAGPRWVAPGFALGPDGPIENDDLVYLPNGSTFPPRVRYPVAEESDWRAVAQEAFKALLNMNDPSVVLPVLGWFFAAPFKPRIMKILKHYPILWVWGTRESGKTSMLKEVFWRLAGVADTEPFSVTETEFAMLKLISSTNAVPVFLDEYRPDDMSPRRLNTLHRFLRRIYGGEVEERGRPDLSVISYELSAPLCIGGEARPDDPAIIDRLVSVTPDPNELKNNPEHREAFAKLLSLRLDLLAAPYLQFVLGREIDHDLEQAIRTTDRILDEMPSEEKVSIRCRDNLRIVVFGLMMFEVFAQEVAEAADLPELDMVDAVSATIEDLMDGEQGAKNQLDEFIETCAFLANEGKLEENKHWARIDGLACLHLRSCWEIYLEHRRRVGRPDTPGGIRALRRQLRENHSRGGYVKELDKTIYLGGGRPRAISIDLDQAGQFLDVHGFPEGSVRTWGGPRDTTEPWDE